MIPIFKYYIMLLYQHFMCVQYLKKCIMLKQFYYAVKFLL